MDCCSFLWWLDNTSASQESLYFRGAISCFCKALICTLLLRNVNVGIAGLQITNGSHAWTDNMWVSTCARPYPCQTSAYSFSMIYKRVCSHHADLAHDLGAYSGLLHLTWVHKDKYVLRWGEALTGLTAIGLRAKKAWGSIRSLFRMLAFLFSTDSRISGHFLYLKQFWDNIFLGLFEQRSYWPSPLRFQLLEGDTESERADQLNP